MALVARARAARRPASTSGSGRPSATPPCASCFTLSGWTFGYVVANQVALIVVKNLAKPGSGGQDAYAKAFTFFQLPHGLLAMSITTTFVPDLARFVARRDRPRFVARVVARRPPDRARSPSRPSSGSSCSRGRSSARSCSGATSTRRHAAHDRRALAGFSLGLVGFSVYLFVLRGFYAHQDTRTPFVINLVENALNIVLAIVLVDRYGVLGLGLAFALAYVLTAAWALQVLSYKVPGFGLAPDHRQPGHACCWLRWSWPSSSGSWPGRRWRRRASAAVGKVMAGTVVGIAVYLGLLALLRGAGAGGGSGAIGRAARLPAMFKLVRRWWKYLTAKLTGSFNEKADPKVQLEQAILEAQDQHLRLKEQAANVIANQKQTELRLNRPWRSSRRLNANARQARAHGRRREQGGRRRQGARSSPGRRRPSPPSSISVEREVEDLKTLVLQATQASDQAKAAVQQNSRCCSRSWPRSRSSWASSTRPRCRSR